MTSDNFSIELDSKFIESFFGLADMLPPEEITLSDLKTALAEIKEKIKELTLNTSATIKANNLANNTPAVNDFMAGGVKEDSSNRPKTVLIVDDLGIITYQLDILFKKMGFEVVISHEIYDAIEKYKKQDFGYAVIDLFIPTEREGFILLDELKKLSLLCKLNTRIIVMTASAKPEFNTKCLNRGADAYIEKSAGWQKAIMEACVVNK
ncbi:MAG: hypothetical protein ACD_20C00435G0008 [uncultured bacterium]|nr:MAG: hypothetical protein ACD_20C00435G0008 [uncultured bacterium]